MLHVQLSPAHLSARLESAPILAITGRFESTKPSINVNAAMSPPSSGPEKWPKRPSKEVAYFTATMHAVHAVLPFFSYLGCVSGCVHEKSGALTVQSTHAGSRILITRSDGGEE